VTLRGRCDAPWAWEFPKTLSYNFTGNEIKDFITNIYNDSDNNAYIFPIVEFGLNSIGNSFSIENLDDDNHTFSFTGMSPMEEIYVDNDREILTSSTGLLRLSNFNKHWFRLKPGNNELHVVSGIGTVSITSQFARKIGV
jgi:phage-related protein